MKKTLIGFVFGAWCGTICTYSHEKMYLNVTNGDGEVDHIKKIHDIEIDHIKKIHKICLNNVKNGRLKRDHSVVLLKNHFRDEINSEEYPIWDQSIQNTTPDIEIWKIKKMAKYLLQPAHPFEIYGEKFYLIPHPNNEKWYPVSKRDYKIMENKWEESVDILGEDISKTISSFKEEIQTQKIMNCKIDNKLNEIFKKCTVSNSKENKS